MTPVMSPFASRWVLVYFVDMRLTDETLQAFDFSFEDEESIEGMKRLIVDEVTAFRSLVRTQARAAGQARRQDTCVCFTCFFWGGIQLMTMHVRRLPIPSRDEIINSPVVEDGATSSFTFSGEATRPSDRAASPIMDDPSEDLERELRDTHLNKNVGA